MKPLVIRLVIGLLSATCSGFILAAPVTYNFTGVVTNNATSAADIGQIVTGSITVDLSTLYILSTTPTYNYAGGYFYPSSSASTPHQTNPLQVYGSATDGTSNVTVGGGTLVDSAIVELRRNDDPINSFLVWSHSALLSNQNRYISIQVYDFLGAASQIFDTPAGDLSLDQDVNWLSPTASTAFNMSESIRTGGLVSSISGYLTSVTVVQAIPEPATIALASIALLGVAVSRRKRAAKH